MKNIFEKREAEILNSIEGIRPAEVPPYFYTRLIARMQHELVEKKQTFFLFRPAFLLASLSVFLIVNIFFLFQFNDKDRSFVKQPVNKATIESFADAYNLGTTIVYE